MQYLIKTSSKSDKKWRMNSDPREEEEDERSSLIDFFVLGHFALLVHPILCYFRFGPYLH